MIKPNVLIALQKQIQHEQSNARAYKTVFMLDHQRGKRLKEN
jgi:hypothetical protein